MLNHRVAEIGCLLGRNFPLLQKRIRRRIMKQMNLHCILLCHLINREKNLEENSQLNDLESPSKVLSGPLDPSAMEKIMSGNLGDPQNQVNENALMCRICDVKIPVVYLEDHSRICTVADRCDFKGLSVNERLDRVTETLHKIMESATLKSSDAAGVNIPEAATLSSSSITDESDGLSPEMNNLYRPCSEGMIDCLPEVVSSFLGHDIKGLENVSSNAHLVRAIAQGTTTSSSGSMTPRSPLLTPRTSQIDLLLAGSSTFWENENLSQIDDLLDVIRSIKNVNDDDYTSLQYLLSYLTDLQDIVEGKFLITGTFGRRAQKLLAEKYAHLCGEIDDDNVDNLHGMAEEVDVNMAHKSKARKQGTSIEDFVIIKPISRGAFGRVFLAKKKTTDDLFAIKVLRKDDMIRKNAVESILAERDILISARNPFVVRFFYSFTCEENLYLVMEYLNGGDLYSLLRNLGCLEEEMARTYIAEVVLALEYLHSLNVVHRDLKPDNLLINHDGHIKLTDFGLSKVGLINSTDDLSGPDISCTAVVGDKQPIECAVQQKQKREQRQKQSAVGTPDYLAPEILLGMGHGPTADWWSVGIILFELLVGIPPFNAEHPQKIFDNIMNRDIPWPQIPEEMTYEAYDLIDKLLNENPIQRLGATGAGEVKQHAFFKNINWEKLGREKASFIPSADGAYDTSYFTCRHEWDSRDCQINHLDPNDDDDATDTCSASCSSGTQLYEDGDKCGSLTDFVAPTLSVKYSFSNFSFKNLSQLALMNYEMIKGGKNSPSTSNPSLP
ncbi:Serine/threonine-protein kinase AtPK2/AtPK19 [Acorus gramineus]|uniref:non-specific serine/threonine protein kinase n=1 Tax=Acorus gramineus TaxID=55184 RepID=A0AAV9BMQ3_ACOGR|nr:Serine/threonine-protein kinase AtPK2/AtPK19 [Acorus gramineus]